MEEDTLFINPLTPFDNQDRISPYTSNTISSRQVMRLLAFLYKLTFFKVTQRRPVEILYRKDHLNEQQASKPNGGKGFHDRQWKLPPTKPFSISVFSTLVKQY